MTHAGNNPVVVFYVLVICLSLRMASPSQADPVFVDPINDTFGDPIFSQDIAELDSRVTRETVTFSVLFHNSISAPSAVANNSVVGFIDLDIDMDPSTGVVSNQSRFSPEGSSDLGIEYFVDLFTELLNVGQVELVDTSTNLATATVPIEFTENSFSVTIPLALLGNDDGRMNYGAIFGDVRDYSDQATNPGGPVATTIPEPATCSLCAFNLFVLLGRRWRRTEFAAAQLRYPKKCSSATDGPSLVRCRVDLEVLNPYRTL